MPRLAIPDPELEGRRWDKPHLAASLPVAVASTLADRVLPIGEAESQTVVHPRDLNAMHDKRFERP